MNNKGFMMAEVVVVASIVVVTLVGFYTSYNKIVSLYNQRVDYYDVNTLYRLANVRDENFWDLYNNDPIGEITDDIKEGETVYYLNSSSLTSLSVANETFKEYISYLDTSETFKEEKILIMEKCNSDGKTNCRYAYLEVDFDAIDFETVEE